jgi:hypothetical protein
LEKRKYVLQFLEKFYHSTLQMFQKTKQYLRFCDNTCDAIKALLLTFQITPNDRK